MIWEAFHVQSFKVAREWINDYLTWKTVFVGSRLGSREEGPPGDTFCKFGLTFLHFMPFCPGKKMRHLMIALRGLTADSRRERSPVRPDSLKKAKVKGSP